MKPAGVAKVDVDANEDFCFFSPSFFRTNVFALLLCLLLVVARLLSNT